MKDHSNNIVKSAEVIGVTVKNPEGDKLGKIEEIVLDKLSGQVHYVVLSFGGILGMGDKFFAFPWKSISYSKDDKSFILNVSKDKLKGAPGFDKDHWPDMAQEQWARDIKDYYSDSLL
jgi:sporulation protein YlmC with PRC-barrel domain